MRLIVFARALLIGAAVLVMATSPATAVPPDQFPFEVSDSGTYDCQQFGYGFDLISEYEQSGIYKVFYDNQGNERRATQHVQWFGTITNTLTGEEFRDHGTWTSRWEIEEGVDVLYWETGAPWTITIPGEGAVFFNAGRFVLDLVTGDVSWTGQNDWQTGGQEALCNALQ